MSDEYFCSYMVFRQSAIFAYGDLIFDSKVDDYNKLLGNIKDHIKKEHYQDVMGVSVVITSLNKLTN